MSLADDIEREAGSLAFDYPKGASLSDVAGYFGAPLPKVEAAIAELQSRGVALPFLKKGESAHLSAEARKRSRQSSENVQRAELLRQADVTPVGDGVTLTGRDDGPLSDVLQEAMKSLGGSIDANGHGRFASEKSPDAVTLGEKGGRARAASMSPEKRSEQARKAATARWSDVPVIQSNGILREPTATERLVERLRPMLPKFAQQFPFGMTARDMRNHTNASANVVYEAIQTLVFERLGIWESELDGKSNTHRFYVRGMRQLPPVLTNNQEAVYESAMRLARNGRAIINCANVDKENSLSPGSAITVLYTLERKGLVRRITPWDREGKKTPAEYEVLPMEPREIEWPPIAPPILQEEDDAPREGATSDGRRIGKQMRRAKADYTRPQEDMVQALIFRRQFLQEELRSLDALVAHYKIMFNIK